MIRLLDSRIAALALLLPAVAFANIGPTAVTLNNGQFLDLDTGDIVTSGGDIQFTGSGISFLGSATGADVSSFSTFSGSSGYATLTSQDGFGIFDNMATSGNFKSTPVALTASNVNDIIGIKTNGDNFSALLVTAVSSASFTFQMFTFEQVGPPGTGAPTITAVINNYGLIPAGFSNSGIAPGSLFIIKGSNLATAVSAVLQDPHSPLPVTLSGASVSVKVGSVTVTPVFYYAMQIQLALVMPSNVPLGPGTVTVTCNGVPSNAYSINVVASAFGMLSGDQTGTGMVKAVNPADTTNPFPYIDLNNSAIPGTIVSIYGSGMGGDPTRDTTFTQTDNYPFTINALTAVYVGGVSAQIQYQGASGYPGLNQLNIKLDLATPTGCFVSVVGVTASGTPTNFLTMPVGNGGPCQDSDFGSGASPLNAINSYGSYKLGFVEMAYSQSGDQPPAIDAIASFLNFPVASFSQASDFITLGGCTVLEKGANGNPNPPAGLSAGTITVTSPNNVTPQAVALTSFAPQIPGYYASLSASNASSTLPAGFLTQAGGTFSFSATQGSEVGPFTASVVFPTPFLGWTNQSSITTVTEASGVTVNWSDGQSGTYVIITGNSSSGSASGTFYCTAPAEAGTFTVPPYVLVTLPPSSKGSLTVAAETLPNPFTATGLTYGFALGYLSFSSTVAYQ